VTPERYFDGQMLELGRAIAKGNTAKIVAAINSGADPNGIGREGVTPLIFAYGLGQKKAMVTLLENKADPNMRITDPQAPREMRDRTAVTIIAGTPDNEYLEILLDHGGDINAKDSGGRPILIEMIFTDPTNYEGMKMLLERGADKEATDSSGASLLIVLARVCDFKYVFYMLQHGADYKKKEMNGFDISTYVFNYTIKKDEFPEGYEWQRKCKEFLLAHGVKDPGPLKPKVETPEEQAEWLRMYKRALEEDVKRHGG
jgi:ankyrin repeat protein